MSTEKAREISSQIGLMTDAEVKYLAQQFRTAHNAREHLKRQLNLPSQAVAAAKAILKLGGQPVHVIDKAADVLDKANESHPEKCVCGPCNPKDNYYDRKREEKEWQKGREQ